MTDEELHAAQPPGDFKFQLADESSRTDFREVVVPNWMAKDGRWAEIYNALQAARNGKIASATEQIVKAIERAREYGREEEAAKCGTTGGHSDDPPITQEQEFQRRVVRAQRRLENDPEVLSHRVTVTPEDSEAFYQALSQGRFAKGETEHDRQMRENRP